MNIVQNYIYCAPCTLYIHAHTTKQLTVRVEIIASAPTVARPVPVHHAAQPALAVARTVPVAPTATAAPIANVLTVEQQPRVPVEIPVRV